MKFKFVLKDGSIITGEEVDYFNNNIRVIDMGKPNENSELEDCTFSVYMICPDSLVYSSCENLTYDEYCDYLDSCKTSDEEIKGNICNCETCTECDCTDCDESNTAKYDFKNEPSDNMYN